MPDAAMRFIGRYFERDWYVADDRFAEPGFYYWNELQQKNVRAWKPGVALDTENALRAERVVLQDENQELRNELKSAEHLLGLLEDEIKLRRAGELELHARIDKVADIIGERIDGIDDILKRLKPVADVLRTQDEISAMRPVPFPTGGASTAEAAAEAVLPVPQRGDRVRLEGVHSIGHARIKDGWYDVVGSDGDLFQVRMHAEGDIVGLDLYWIVGVDNAGLKEVRHADHT